MQQHVGVDDQEQPGPQHEEGYERQIDVEEWQFDRIHQQKVAMCYANNGYREIKEHEEIAEPKASPDARRVDDCVAQGLEIPRRRQAD